MNMDSQRVTNPELEKFVVSDVQQTGRKLGQGAYGCVEEAEIPGATVATKRLHPALIDMGSPEQVQKWVTNFVEQCILLSQLRHPHIVQFMGVCYFPDSPIPALLMEKLQTSLDKLIETSPSIPLDIELHLLTGTARGIVYLHSQSPPIMHRDLTARDILIDSGLTAKIAGLGVAKRASVHTQDHDRDDATPGTLLFAAPETFPGDSGPVLKYNVAIDIFSFGVVALYTFTQMFPSDIAPKTFQDPTTQKVVTRSEIERRGKYIQSLKTALGETHPLVHLTLNCLEDGPSDRPSAHEVLTRLKEAKGIIHQSCSQTKLELMRRVAEKEEEIRILSNQDSEQQHQLERSQAANNQEEKVSGDLVQQLLEEQTKLQEDVRSREEENRSKGSEISQLQLRLQNELATITQLEQQLTQLTAEKQQLSQQHNSDRRQLEQQLTQSNASRGRLEQQIVGLRKLLSAQKSRSEDIEFWEVSREEVTLHHDQELGRGGWGVVLRGKFRGKEVAVKCIHQENLAYQREILLERFRREIQMMAKLRHPNLVLFMAAVLDDLNDPPIMIVTEILETTLRKIVEKNRVGKNKLSIFREIASALLYLHEHKQEIIHRDVSTANVLVCASANGTWTAKLSDFGSANLAQIATTLGDGALVYTAPEAYPQPALPQSPPPPPQTTKIDVYSFGVLTCEVITRVFPDPRRLAETVRSINRVWPEMYHMVSSCVEYRPEGRPTMGEVLTCLNELDREP